jgi:hypothetical protein
MRIYAAQTKDEGNMTVRTMHSEYLAISALFCSSKIPEKYTMQKEDFPSHRTCDTRMKY